MGPRQQEMKEKIQGCFAALKQAALEGKQLGLHTWAHINTDIDRIKSEESIDARVDVNRFG